jgi:hypothetical protein
LVVCGLEADWVAVRFGEIRFDGCEVHGQAYCTLCIKDYDREMSWMEKKENKENKEREREGEREMRGEIGGGLGWRGGEKCASI